MFKKSELTRAGGRNLYSYLKNYLDYKKLNIDEERYTKRLEYLYGWLYPRAALVDEYLENIAFIEKTLFEVFDSESLLTKYEYYKHLFMEFEEISFALSENAFNNGNKYPISKYLLEYFDKFILVSGYKNNKYKRELIEDIRRDFIYSFNLKGYKSNRFVTMARVLKG